MLLGAGAWFWLGRASSPEIPEPTASPAVSIPAELPSAPEAVPAPVEEPAATEIDKDPEDRPVAEPSPSKVEKVGKKAETAAKDVKEAKKNAPPPPPPEPDPADKKTGKVFVTSRPSGAKVALDGRVVGKTPLELEIKGQGRLSLSLDGYAILEKDVRLADVRGTLNLVLQASGASGAGGGASTSMGKFFLSSSPAGAEIVVQGKVIGKTPKMVELPVGNRTLNLRSGALQKSIDVELKEGQNPAQHVPL